MLIRSALLFVVTQLTTYTVDMLVHSKLFIDASKKAGVKHMVVRQQALAHSSIQLTATHRDPVSSAHTWSMLLCMLQHLGVDGPEDKPLRVAIWHRMIEGYIEVAGFDTWTHLHPTFYMEVNQHPRTASNQQCFGCV